MPGSQNPQGAAYWASMGNVKMLYALAGDGTLARATTAPKGPEHPYTCLDCGTRVKLRRGPERAPHFSHFEVTDCTGEGVLHRAAKLELARALRERERPFTLHVPCSWPSCPETIAVPFDLIAGPHTEVVTEYPVPVGDTVYRVDVATLLHGRFQAGFEVYHRHRVPEEKRQSALSNWVEIHAEPLLDSPYDLWMVRDTPPVNPAIEDFVHLPEMVTQVQPLEIYHYRARGSGKWVFEEPDGEGVHIDTYEYYTCPAHTGLSDRLLGAAYAHHFPKEAPDPEPAPPLAFETSLERHRKAAEFAAAFYQVRGISGEALGGLVLRACRCPHCRKAGVFVMSPYAVHWTQFRGLVQLSKDRRTLLNYCGHCQTYAHRKLLGLEEGATLPGELVAARLLDLAGAAP